VRAFLRAVLLVVIGFLLLAVIIAIGSVESGAVEKIALILAAVALLVAASVVYRRLA
jgi:uncharacterized membrane protein YhaH (DUF805 family)